MEIYLIIGLIIVVIILLKFFLGSTKEAKKVFQDNVYKYTPKNTLMSNAETDFFIRLERIASDRYYIFPQVHLSSLLDHRVKGQEWKYAFRHINGKSVDYVLCSKQTLRPTYAVELDDYTHNYDDRKKRDSEVERIFEEAGIPLVRFRNYKEMSDEDMANSFAHAKTLVESSVNNS